MWSVEEGEVNSQQLRYGGELVLGTGPQHFDDRLQLGMFSAFSIQDVIGGELQLVGKLGQRFHGDAFCAGFDGTKRVNRKSNPLRKLCPGPSKAQPLPEDSFADLNFV